MLFHTKLISKSEIIIILSYYTIYNDLKVIVMNFMVIGIISDTKRKCTGSTVYNTRKSQGVYYITNNS